MTCKMLQAVVEQLVAAGADPAARTRHGLTPLLVAAAAGRAGSVRALLGRVSVVGETDPAGQAALALAAQAGSRELVQLLLDSGADLVLNFTFESLQFTNFLPQDGQDRAGMCSLHCAVVRAHIPTVKLLLGRGAFPNHAARRAAGSQVLRSIDQ